MSDKKKFSEWEVEKGFLVRDADTKQLNEKLTEQEFMDKVVVDDRMPFSIHWESRVQFLKDNGYEVTRENLGNVELSANLDYQREQAAKKKK